MPACAVSTCKNRSSTSNLEKDGITFHLFPRNSELQKIWTTSCSRQPNWVPTRTSSICSKHFEASQFQSSGDKRRKLIDFAVPTLFLYKKVKNVKTTAKSVGQQGTPPAQTTSGPILSTSNEQQQLTMQNSSLQLTRNRKLTERIKTQQIKIKRLQAKIRYLKSKVASLEELLNI